MSDPLATSTSPASDLGPLFGRAAAIAADFRSSLDERPVGRPTDADPIGRTLGGTLQADSTSPETVLDELVSAVEPGLVATAGPRYFGFVIGGSLPAATAAEMVAAGWDQCAFNAVLSPASIAVERAAGGWLKALLGLPATVSCGFVTGAQQANTVGLAVGRHAVLERCGWDVRRDGLFGAPRVRVVAGAERHATIDRALRLLGLGETSIEPVAVDANGAIDVADLERVLSGAGGRPTIVCLQAGNVNTGAVDDLRAGCALAHERGAWVHVDGAFGMWAAASPALRHLVDGIELADSWACDGHKWLNVPYDSAYAFCRDPELHATAVSYTAAYLTGSGTGDPGGADLALESSRRARGFATWAALRQLGTDGVADLVDRCCAHARRFAGALEAHGATIGNDVVLNQVLARFGDDATTDAVVDAVQRDGTCWMGGTTWRGERYMRIAVSNWSTTEADVDRSVEAIVRAATGARAAPR